MDVLPLTAADFAETVARNDLLVMEFSADIGAFRDRASMVPTSGVRWGHVDPRTEDRLLASFGIETACALLIFREQIVLYLESGEHSAEQIADLLRRIKTLDMDKVRAEIDAQKRAEVAVRMRRVCPAMRRGPVSS